MTRFYLSAAALAALAACQPAPPPADAPAAPAANTAACAGDATCIAGATLAARLNAAAGTDIGGGVVLNGARANNNLVTVTVQATDTGRDAENVWFQTNQGIIAAQLLGLFCAEGDYTALRNGGGIVPVDVNGTAGQRLGTLSMARCPVGA